MHELTTIVPAELRELPQWVCWKYVDRAGKRTKCPVNPKFGWNASATDPSTWTTFAEAVEASERHAGIAFAFTADDPYCGLDLDDCLDEHGELIWGHELLAEFDTYTEVSPSGRGLKLFLRGTKPEHARCKQAGFGPDGSGSVEVYDRNRVFVVTGRAWPETPTEVEHRQDELDALCGRLWPHTPAPEPPRPALEPTAGDRIGRCLDAVLRMRMSDRGDGSRRLYTAACRCVEHDLSDAEAVEVVREFEARQPFPQPWSEPEIVRRLRDAERHTRRGLVTLPSTLSVPEPITVNELVTRNPDLRRPVLHGLIREGETMNVIAATKIGKSWLVLDLALAIASGSHWLGAFRAEPGRVLIIDNELHPETSANRIPKVVEARGYPLSTVCEQVEIVHLRGRLKDIHSYGPWFRSLDTGRYSAIVIDAAYRFMPPGMDENDNGAMAAVYNEIDGFADQLKCCFVAIHHASKGDQSAKAITDVGSGAGSQSRAADTHLVLRQHMEPNCVVLDAAVRSWPPIESRVLRWTFPVFEPDDTLDPADLKPAYQRRSRRKPPIEKPEKPEWTTEKFVEAFVGSEPKAMRDIVEEALDGGLSMRRAKRMLRLAERDGLVHSRREGVTRPLEYSTLEPPAEAA